jgi:hypothetical protein
MLKRHRGGGSAKSRGPLFNLGFQWRTVIQTERQHTFLEINLLSIWSWMPFTFVAVIPTYVTFVASSKEPVPELMSWNQINFISPKFMWVLSSFLCYTGVDLVLLLLRKCVDGGSLKINCWEECLDSRGSNRGLEKIYIYIYIYIYICVCVCVCVCVWWGTQFYFSLSYFSVMKWRKIWWL